MRVAVVAKYLESLMRLGGQFSPRPELGSCAALLFCNIYYPCRATCPSDGQSGRPATSFEPHPEHRIRLPISGTAKVGPSSATRRAEDIVALCPQRLHQQKTSTPACRISPSCVARRRASSASMYLRLCWPMSGFRLFGIFSLRYKDKIEQRQNIRQGL